MQVEVESTRSLVFDDGSPVQAASALARLGDGWLVAQDDATHGAWVRPSGTSRLRLLPPVQGLDVFSEAEGTEDLRPDLEAACGLTGGVLLLGSGSTQAHRGAVLVLEHTDGPRVASADLPGLYDAVQAALGLDDGELDVEGVARNGDVLRWFSRGDALAGTPDCSVDVGLPGLLEALRGERDPADVPLNAPRRYALPDGLSATDAVALPGGRVLLSAASATRCGLVLLEDDEVLSAAELPPGDGAVPRVEGLGVLGLDEAGARLLAVVDAEDPAVPSLELTLRVRWS